MVLPEASVWRRPAPESFPGESPTPGISTHLSSCRPVPGTPPRLGPAQTVPVAPTANRRRLAPAPLGWNTPRHKVVGRCHTRSSHSLGFPHG